MKYLFNATKFIDNHRFIACEMETSDLEVLKRWNRHFVDLFNPYTDTIILGYVINCDDCDLVNDDGSAIDTIKMPKIDLETTNKTIHSNKQNELPPCFHLTSDLSPKAIYHNAKKNTTCVVFYDNTKIIVKRIKGDKDNIYTAVAYAIAKKLFKSNNAFTKMVDKAVKE